MPILKSTTTMTKSSSNEPKCLRIVIVCRAKMASYIYIWDDRTGTNNLTGIEHRKKKTRKTNTILQSDGNGIIRLRSQSNDCLVAYNGNVRPAIIIIIGINIHINIVIIFIFIIDSSLLLLSIIVLGPKSNIIVEWQCNNSHLNNKRPLWRALIIEKRYKMHKN